MNQPVLCNRRLNVSANTLAYALINDNSSGALIVIPAAKQAACRVLMNLPRMTHHAVLGLGSNRQWKSWGGIGLLLRCAKNKKAGTNPAFLREIRRLLLVGFFLFFLLSLGGFFFLFFLFRGESRGNGNGGEEGGDDGGKQFVHNFLI